MCFKYKLGRTVWLSAPNVNEENQYLTSRSWNISLKQIPGHANILEKQLQSYVSSPVRPLASLQKQRVKCLLKVWNAANASHVFIRYCKFVDLCFKWITSTHSRNYRDNFTEHKTICFLCRLQTQWQKIT